MSIPSPVTLARDIQAFHVMEVLRRAKALEQQGASVIHMEIGEPDFDTPKAVLDAAAGALQRTSLKYTQAGGLPELREAIAGYYGARHGVAIDSQRIFVTPGASGALLLALAAAIPEAGRVLITDPGYPCYRNFVRVLGGTPEAVDIRPSNYRLTAETLENTWRDDVNGLIFASPSNPTGTVTGADDMAKLLAFIDACQGFCISDEIYHGLEYEQPCPTALAASRRAFVINSFSKYFGMTGWRLGWAVVPEGYEEIAERLAQNLFISAPTLSQAAAMAAFEPANIAELERRRREFGERRDYLYGALASLGFALPAPPSGAFYIYADCSALTDDSHQFCLDLLEQAHVAITPGKDFGDRDAERYVRFAYTRPIDVLAEGVARIQRFIGR